MKFPKFLFLFIVASSAGIFLAGCASAGKDPTAAYKNQSAEQIFHEGEVSLAKQKYSTASEQFEALDALYPFGPNSEQAELELMYAYYQNDDVASAAAAADRFIRLYPRNAHVDYAYYMKSLADFEQSRGWMQRYFPTDLSERDPGTTKQAFDDFNELLRLFPTSYYAPDARQRMIYLRNLFANYELNVAKFYYQHGAYVAAANRANYILQHYNGTPQTEEALGILVRSYRMLYMPNQAYQSLQILQLNFPNGRVLWDVQRGR